MIGEIGEILEWLRAATAGWRFVFSPAYRDKVIAEWRVKSRYSVTWDIICGFAGIALTIALVVLVILLILGSEK